MQVHRTKETSTAPQTPTTRGEFSAPAAPRKVIASVDWLGVVSKAAEQRAEALRAALEAR